jgi:hypothetical protein
MMNMMMMPSTFIAAQSTRVWGNINAVTGTTTTTNATTANTTTEGINNATAADADTDPMPRASQRSSKSSGGRFSLFKGSRRSRNSGSAVVRMSMNSHQSGLQSENDDDDDDSFADDDDDDDDATNRSGGDKKVSSLHTHHKKYKDYERAQIQQLTAEETQWLTICRAILVVLFVITAIALGTGLFVLLREDEEDIYNENVCIFLV